MKFPGSFVTQRTNVFKLFNCFLKIDEYKKLRDLYGSFETTIKRIVKQFSRSGSLEDQWQKNYSRSCLQHNIDFVRANVVEEPVF